MTEIWYNSDEVGVFHPAVQSAMSNAINTLGLDTEIELIHHPSIPNSSIIPDFGLKLRRSNRFIFIVEVKRTVRDVYSQRYQNQSKSYVSDCAPYWEPGYHPYFCLTNIEELLLFAERSGPISNCLLKNNPKSHSRFDPSTHDADTTISEFEETMVQIIDLVYRRISPEWDNNWHPIIESFYENYGSIKSQLEIEEDQAGELTLYELFRLLAYGYLKGFYRLTSNQNSSYFRAFPSNALELEAYKRILVNAFDRVQTLDFKQVFDNYPNPSLRIFPEHLQERTLGYFKNCIDSLRDYCDDAVADNSSPEYIFNLLTSKVYNWEVLHEQGKIMTDRELAELLATVTIRNDDDQIIDPCSGDGALMDAAYHRLHMLSLDSGTARTHNEFLGSITGIEVDPFLAQLATFRLVAKNLTEVSTDTEAEVIIGDAFEKPDAGSYDVVLMNPPFLRSDNKRAPITSTKKHLMNTAINNHVDVNFVENARQANLYFYFVNYVWHYLNDRGRAGLILMAKFLNSIDGVHIKGFMLDKLESVILYPRNYFGEFKVTTVIATLSKEPSENIKFLRITDERILSNPGEVSNILSSDQSVIRDSYSLRITDRNISANSNWKLFLIDPQDKYQRLMDFPHFVSLRRIFGTVRRGGAENSGGSRIIYPDFGSEPYSSLAEEHRGYGVKNSRSIRSLVLTEEDLNIEPAIHFPSNYDSGAVHGLNSHDATDEALSEIFRQNDSENPDRWRRIVNAAFRSQISFDILIPRAERTKHCCYYNSGDQQVVLSTNFFYLSDFISDSGHASASNSIQKKFVAAFLNSSFGQVQFEINSNNQEGARKLEGFHVDELRIPDLSLLTEEELMNVTSAFEDFSSLGIVVSGDEGRNSQRRALDMAVANVLFERDPMDFQSSTELVDFFELFLADLVIDRRL